MATEIDAQQVTHEIAASLAPNYDGVLSLGTIERFVSESFAELAGEARITDYLVLLTERTVAERLRQALASMPGVVPAGRPPEVLLVCLSSGGLGLVAAAMLDALGEGRVRVRVAGEGSPPSLTLAGAARRDGLRVDGRWAEPLTREAVSAADVVVTMRGDDAPPLVEGKRYVDWQLETPARAGAASLVEEIRVRSGVLLAELRRGRPRRRVIPL